ncbi:MAG: sortase [Patescibacteria group bacterium]
MDTAGTPKSNEAKAVKGSSILSKAGITLVVVAALIVLLTFYPIFKEEAKYLLAPSLKEKVVLSQDEANMTEKEFFKEKQVIVPVDETFGIVVPKIGANSPIVPDVDWKDGTVYQKALTKGVAHAEGTAKPGERGNMFLFAHSGVDFYEAARYNAVFYLIGKLEEKDTVEIFYQGKPYVYRVTEKKIVASDDTSYLLGDPKKETLTLMTCWPAGTTLKRLIVIAERQNAL